MWYSIPGKIGDKYLRQVEKVDKEYTDEQLAIDAELALQRLLDILTLEEDVSDAKKLMNELEDLQEKESKKWEK